MKSIDVVNLESQVPASIPSWWGPKTKSNGRKFVQNFLKCIFCMSNTTVQSRWKKPVESPEVLSEWPSYDHIAILFVWCWNESGLDNDNHCLQINISTDCWALSDLLDGTVNKPKHLTSDLSTETRKYIGRHSSIAPHGSDKKNVTVPYPEVVWQSAALNFLSRSIQTVKIPWSLPSNWIRMSLVPIK